MRRTIATFAILILTAFGMHGQSVCKKFDKKGKPKCCGATSFADCPRSGCNADLKLNAAKNRTDKPTDAEAQPKTILQIANFTRPAKWKGNTSRSLLESWGEGTPVVVMLFIKDAKGYKNGAEACNCNLGGERNNDFHIVLVNRPTDPERESLTAEISPRIRPNGWTLDKLERLADRSAFVRVTGWAMLDTQHLNDRHPIRKTHWEIHPVTKFEVCTQTIAKCREGQGWERLEDTP